MASLIVSIVAIFVGIFVAIAVPIAIERKRRPALTIDLAHSFDTTGNKPIRFVHVRVTNMPLRREDSGFFFRQIDTWLMRSVATGCRVFLSFEELGTDKRPVQGMVARWDAAPEPFNFTTDPAGNMVMTFDMTKTPQGERFDLSPDPQGETLAVAIKHDGASSAFAFNANSYQMGEPNLWCFPKYELAGDEYRVRVEARSGGISFERVFRLRNYGTQIADFRLEPEG
jgi:hypothetical protein